MVKRFSPEVISLHLTNLFTSLCSCQIGKIYIKLCFIVFAASPLLSFLLFSFLSSQTFLFIQALRHIETSNSFLLIYKRKSSSTDGFNLKDICGTFCCCWGGRDSYLFISPLCISWIKVLCVPSSLSSLGNISSWFNVFFFILAPHEDF